MRYFGPPARCPEWMPQVPTPTGAPCHFCNHPVEADARGFMIPRLHTDPDGFMSCAGEDPVHDHCLARWVSG